MKKRREEREREREKQGGMGDVGKEIVVGPPRGRGLGNGVGGGRILGKEGKGYKKQKQLIKETDIMEGIWGGR